jgi:hypothetical protein
MVRIIDEVIKNVIRCGYDCDAVIGEEWLIGSNSEQKGTLFQFDLLEWTKDKYGRKTMNLEFWVGFPSLINDATYQADLFDKMEETASKFIYLLRTYEDSDGMKLIGIEDSTWEQYADWSFNEITTSGYKVTLSITKESTSQC